MRARVAVEGVVVNNLNSITMSKDKTKKDCFTIAVNGVPFVNADTVENAVSLCLGLHKMSNLSHKIVLTDGQGAQLVVFRA